MYPLPINTILGTLSMLEVFEYYDHPILFACKNRTGQIYIAVFADENDSGESWLFAPVSSDRFTHVRSGGVDLRFVFSFPEDGLLFRVYFPYAQGSTESAELVPVTEISQEWLPDEGQFVRKATITVPQFIGAPQEKALSIRKEVLNFILDFADRTRTEAPAKLLGRALAGLQDVINTIAAVKRGHEALTGALPPDVIDKNQLVFVAIGPGSFIVELTGEEYVDMFDQSELGDTIDEFLRLVDHGQSKDGLKDHLTRFNTRVAAKYLDFLKVLDDKIERTVFDWGSVMSERSRRAELSRSSIKSVIGVIEQSEDEDIRDLQFTGRLVAANVESRRFTIKIDGANSNIEGVVSQEAFDLFSKATLSARYKIVVRETTRTKVIMGNLVQEFQLLDIRLVTGEEVTISPS